MIDRSMFFGEEISEHIAMRLERAAAAKATELIAVHCEATGFAATIEVAYGLPILWQMVGPVTAEQAASWSGAIESQRRAAGSVPSINRH